MVIKTLHINSFGGLKNREIDLSSGVNVVEGMNEAGKSSAAMFIKFIFYGLSSKSLKADGASERTRYVNRDTMEASGYIIAVADDCTKYRIERSLLSSDGKTYRESVRIINTVSGESVTGVEPGEYFYGVQENVFTGTAFVSQNRSVKPEIVGGNSSSGSVENLLTSADEDVDIKKAIKKLEGVRRELCHKKGDGGEISELEQKKKDLIEERDSNVSRSAEILSVSSSVTDIKRKIEELEATVESSKRTLEALEIIGLKHKYEVLDTTGKALKDVERAVGMIENSPVGGNFEANVLSCERDIAEYRKMESDFDDRMEELKGDEPAEKRPDSEKAAAETLKVYKKTRALFNVSMVLFALGLLAIIATVVMYVALGNRYMIPGMGAFIFVLVAVLLLVFRHKSAGELRDMLNEWDAESVEDMEDAAIRAVKKYDRDLMLAKERAELRDRLEASESRCSAAIKKLSELAASVNVKGSANPESVIKALKSIIVAAAKEKSTLLSKGGNLRGRYEIISEQLEGTDRIKVEADYTAVMAEEYGKTAAGLTEEEIKKVKFEKEFAERELLAAQKRRIALEEKLGELGKLSHSPDEYETLIKSLDERISELSLRRDACTLAEDALQNAGMNMRSGVIPKISRRASEIMEKSTHRYSAVTVDGAFNCGLGENDMIKTPEYFSRGTGDLAYIALRVALAEEVFRGEKPTLVFDESFAHVDSSRLMGIIRTLNGEKGQYVIFTCRTEEAEIASELGCNSITL